MVIKKKIIVNIVIGERYADGKYPQGVKSGLFNLLKPGPLLD